MMKVGKRFVNKLNKLIPIKSEADRDELNRLIEEMWASEENEWPKNDLYWDRDLYIGCNGDRDKLREIVLHSGLVQFEVSEDTDEHPGVVVRYKNKQND